MATTSKEDCRCEDTVTDGSINGSLPSQSDLSNAYSLWVLDASGRQCSFGSIVDTPGIDRHLIIFIRHLFCTSCQQYIKALRSHLPPASLPSKTRITLISNGNPSYILQYRSITSCPYALCLDTENTPLYKAMKLGKSAKSGPQPDYVTTSVKSSVVSALKQMISAGRKGVKGMNSWQNGGEFLFERRGAEMECVWAHRMQNTRDHTEAKLLREVITTGSIDMTRPETGLEWVERARKMRLEEEKKYHRKLNGMIGSGT